MSRYTTILLLTVLFIACKPEFDDIEVSKGSADLTSYVAIGNSLTAGYADNALYLDGQENSFPSILANQFKLAGGAATFNQPLMPAGVGFGSQGNARYMLQPSTNCQGITSVGPAAIAESGDQNVFNSIADQAPFNNMGVPGAKSFHLLLKSYGDPSGIPTGTANPFFSRMATNPGNVSVLEDAMLNSPTFFTCWLGNNDILGYATSGGSGAIGGTGTNDITDQNTFDASVTAIIDQLTSNGAKGVIINIPTITNIPFFTTVPSFGLTLDETNAAALTQAYAAYNAGALQLGLDQMVFNEGNNGFVISDDDPKYTPLGNLRQIKSTELILLSIPQDSILCAGWGSEKPIPAQYVLDIDEINNISTYTTNFNKTLESISNSKNLSFVDIDKVLSEVKKGVIYDGVSYNATFVTGGTFSLDGVHLTQRGYAIVANTIITQINKDYGANIPNVQVNDYNGVLFP